MSTTHEAPHDLAAATTTLVPLTVVAAELEQPVGLVAARAAEHITVDPESGLRVIPAHVCRHLIEQQASDAEGDRQRRRDFAAQLGAPVAAERARRRAIDARHAEMRATGEVGPNPTAADFVLGGAAANDQRLAASGARLDGWLRGESTGAMFNPPRPPRNAHRRED
jgi:hypothetical protein